MNSPIKSLSAAKAKGTSQPRIELSVSSAGGTHEGESDGEGGEEAGHGEDNEGAEPGEDDLTPEEMEVLKARVWLWLHESPHPTEMVQIGQIGYRRCLVFVY